MPEAEIMEAFNIWVLTDWTVLPGAGGWMDQDERVRRDFMLLLRRFVFQESQIKGS